MTARSSEKLARADHPASPVALHCGSSETMPGVGDGTVTLTVTSPPYWNAIDYDRHASDSQKWYRTRNYGRGFEGYGEYLDLMGRIFGEVFRVTRPGGFCAVVIGTILWKGRHIPAPFDLSHRLCAAGWEFHQDILWHKCTAGVKRAGVTIQKPFPGYFYPNIMTEYILVFRKPGPPIYKEVDPDTRERSRFPINRLFTMDIANNLWHIAPVPPGHLTHPCPFPEEIPHRLITLYSHRDDLVLDPFAGSGQTVKVAATLGRRAVGYDIQEEYVLYARSRIDQPLAVRPQQLIVEFQKIPLDAPAGAISSNGDRKGRRTGKRNPANDHGQGDLFAEMAIPAVRLPRPAGDQPT
ncbi:MAG: site-specific DNA-methyltransferase [Planctomycetes bacterium]|nr:site-specific DNA-methyltransferase [Planctomycetota bacterium]